MEVSDPLCSVVLQEDGDMLCLDCFVYETYWLKSGALQEHDDWVNKNLLKGIDLLL